MNKTNIGVQLMPGVLFVCSVAFYALQNNLYAASCFVLGLLFGIVIMGESFKKD